MMLATALRKSILQAAIAGQLTEQRKDDGDARDLLAAIRKEKAQLVRTGKLKKERPLPEICEDDVPFEIPETWCWAHFSDIVIVATNLVSPENHQNDWQIAPDLIEKGTGRLLGKRTVKEFKTKSGNHHFFKGQILYSKIRPALRKAVIAPYDGLCSADMYPLTSMVETSYLLTLLLSDFFTDQVVKKANRVKMPKINQRELSSILLPVPPRKEQQRIIKAIERLTPELAKLEADEHELDALTSAFPARMKSSLLLAAMRGELTEREEGDGDARDLLKTIEREKKRLIKEKRLKREKPLPPVAEEDVPFEIPETWCWCRLGDVAIFQNGDRGKNYPKRTEYTTRGIPWVNAGHITADGFLSETSMNFISIDKYQELRNGKFQRGDLVYCLRGTLGKVGRIEPYSEGAVASSLMIIRPMVPNVYFREYIFHYLKSALARRQLLQFDNGSAQPNLAAKDVAKYLIPLPPLAEQRRIVARLEELLGAVENG
ncbi:restriction endonuclease subunit S [Selenomonas sp.]|uniref:restriction endonuclease subunit S n=1 Tax=Selenomonas sp. TaxID=2053611 RepID=UPI002A807FB8|nr:restriction endonuclease subunit S [Selenomonas sp.]MDY4416220.1 restriction endonuclease subunit S [Selenomonas sp.]